MGNQLFLNIVKGLEPDDFIYNVYDLDTGQKIGIFGYDYIKNENIWFFCKIFVERQPLKIIINF